MSICVSLPFLVIPASCFWLALVRFGLASVVMCMPYKQSQRDFAFSLLSFICLFADRPQNRSLRSSPRSTRNRSSRSSRFRSSQLITRLRCLTPCVACLRPIARSSWSRTAISERAQPFRAGRNISRELLLHFSCFLLCNARRSDLPWLIWSLL